MKQPIVKKLFENNLLIFLSKIKDLKLLIIKNVLIAVKNSFLGNLAVSLENLQHHFLEFIQPENLLKILMNYKKYLCFSRIFCFNYEIN